MLFFFYITLLHHFLEFLVTILAFKIVWTYVSISQSPHGGSLKSCRYSEKKIVLLKKEC